jgi:uncharacterized membrane protein
MSSLVAELAQRFQKSRGELADSEKRVVDRLTRRLHISRDTNQQVEDDLTVGQRLADQVAAFVGSWTFIILFVLILIFWMLLNSVILARLGKSFDVYPYILLNLVLSTLAALQAPLIMMSQNRQAAKDRLVAAHDYEVNLKAELEILALHAKVDTLREDQWISLVAMQQEQIRLLTQIAESCGRGSTPISGSTRANPS